MKTYSCPSKKRGWFPPPLLPFIALFIGLGLSLAAGAQTVDHKETVTALQTKVHLRLGETTLAKVLQQIAQQTGLQVQPADYLVERELLVDLDNVSAAEALDTLAEGNDWIWYETRKSQIFMARPNFNRMPQLLNVAPAFRVIVPRDLRRYVGVGVTDAELRSAFRQSQPNSDYILKSPEMLDFLDVRHQLLPQLLEGVVNEQERQMVAWVTDEVKTGKQMPYAKLSPEQQHILLVRFVFTAMFTAFGPHAIGTANLIQGLDPAGVDENRMRISYKAGAIYIGILQGGKFSLGEGIMSQKDLPRSASPAHSLLKDGSPAFTDVKRKQWEAQVCNYDHFEQEEMP